MKTEERFTRLEEGVHVSPIQFQLSPQKIKVDKFRHPLFGNLRSGDVVSRILSKSQEHKKYVAVSFDWIGGQYEQAIKEKTSKFDSPLARDLTGINANQIIDTTLSSMVKRDILIQEENLLYLSSKGLGEYLAIS